VRSIERSVVAVSSVVAKICASILFASRLRQRSTLTALALAGQFDKIGDAQPFLSACVAANLDYRGPLWVKRDWSR
jgi:hypothetical protein